MPEKNNSAEQSGAIIKIIPADQQILRRLAGKLAELARRPIEAEKRELWYRHNALEETRPVFFCDPENGWNEIISEGQLECRADYARAWELRLRRDIFRADSMRDDWVVEPYLDVPYSASETDWGMRETKTGGEGGGAYRWDAPLKSYADLEKLRFPKITVDRRETERVLDVAHRMFDGLLTVRLNCQWWWTLGLTWTLVNLRGMEQVMLDMYDQPADLHRLMAFLRDGTMARLDFLESNGLLSLNNDGTYVGSGGYGYVRELPGPGFDGRRVRTRDLWGFAESQETTTVSPEMFAEFIFPYQLPLLARFGLNCYGCCEPIDRRWHVVKQTPNLRRVSVSPWSDLAVMAENLGSRYILSLKPHPADLALPVMDAVAVRGKLREAIRLTRGCRLEIIMKDNNTIGGNPENVVNWCRIAREEAEAA